MLTTNTSAPQDGNSTLKFPLDLKTYSAIGNTIQKETGVMAQTLNLTLQATVHTTAQSAAGPIDKTFVQSMTTNLNGGVLTWDTGLKKSDPGSIETTQPVTTAAKFLGLPVLGVRIASLCLLLMVLILLGYYYLVLRRKNRATDHAMMQALQISQKYKELIVEVKELPEKGIEHDILTVDSLDELIKVAQALLKPINHGVEDNLEIYWLIDGSAWYQYRPVRESSSSGERQKGS